ncbi:MAG: DoxX family protein [Rudaea sp.]
MSGSSREKPKDAVILVARILLVLLFLIFGWSKLTGYSGTVGYMQSVGAPMPALAAVVAIVVEFFGAIALILGICTRPIALVLAIYTLGTALIGHHYWSMTGSAQYENMINFYKNVSIIGGFLLLYATGAGRYSIDARFQRR